MNLTWPQVTAYRLHQHHLDKPAPRKDWLDVVSRIGDLHAQLTSSAELMIAARVRDLTAEDVQRAAWKDRKLVKTWAYRGTLHFIPTRDFQALIGALRVRNRNRPPSWYKYFAATPQELETLMDAVRSVLTGEGITRQQLADAVVKRTGSEHLRELLGSGWGALLKPSAFEGDLCFGPSVGNNVTFVSTRAWIGDFEPVDSDEAIAQMARGFLAAYGPATFDEFARWMGMQPKEVRAPFKGLGDEITEVEVEGWKAWALTASLDEMQKLDKPSGVRLLPFFDLYTVAVAKQAPYLMPESAVKAVYRPQGWISPVILSDGRFAGVWDSKTKRGQTTLSVTWFEKPSAAAKRGLAAETDRLSAYWGVPVTVEAG